MTDLRDVLRSFALQKMQEIKDESKEKEKTRNKDESSSKRKKERKRKEERDSSDHKSKRIALSDSSKHEKHSSHKDHEKHPHKEEKHSHKDHEKHSHKDEKHSHKDHEKRSSHKDREKRSHKDHEKKHTSHKEREKHSSHKDHEKHSSHKDREHTSHKDREHISHKDREKHTSQKDHEKHSSHTDNGNSHSRTDRESKTITVKDHQDKSESSCSKDTEATKVAATKSRSEKDGSEERHEHKAKSPHSSGRSGKVKIIRKEDPKSVLSTKDSVKAEKAMPKELDKDKPAKPEAEIVIIHEVNVEKQGSKEVEIISEPKQEPKQERKSTSLTTPPTSSTTPATSSATPTSSTTPTTSSATPTTSSATPTTKSTTANGKAEKKTIKINIMTKELKVPTPPPSPPSKKPKKELEDGELSESESAESESESDIDSETESEKEAGVIEKASEGSNVPWREQGSSEGEASSTTDSEQEGKEVPLGRVPTNKAEEEQKKKSKKQKHKRKHKKHKHKKDKEKDKTEKDTSKSPKDAGKEKEKGEKDSEKKKSKHKKDKKDKKKDKKSKQKDEEASKDEKEAGEVKESKEKDKDDKDKKRDKSSKKHGSRSRSSSRSESHRKHRRSRSRSQERSRDGPRYRSRSRSRDRFSSSRGIWTRDLRARRRARSRSRDRDRRRRSRSYTPPEKIDKQKLYEIAKANAYAQLQRGELPANLLTKLPPLTQEDKIAQKAGGRTVAELTEVCMQLASTKERDGDDSDSDMSPVNKPVGSDEEAEGPFIRHPFRVKDAPLNIVMNIRNAVPLPVKDKDTLRLQFPVSSGTQHRKKEDETTLKDPYGQWQMVERNKPGPAPAPAKPVPPPTPVAVPTPPPAPVPQGTLGTNVTGPSQAALALAAAAGGSTVDAVVTAAAVATAVTASTTTTGAVALPAITAPPESKSTAEEDKVFEEAPAPSMDISSIVSARLKAARALESNPHDVEALTLMHKSQTEIHNWTVAKQKPGMFTGSTGIKVLRPEELANSNPTKQAWAKKDMFHNQPALKGGIGMHLMQKMGWKQGEGLGISNQGTLVPLALDVKTDRKGLVAIDEQHRRKNQVPQAVYKDLSGKHPVSALMEICNKRKWRPPQFELLQDKGPPHKKQFIFKVIINTEEYIPAAPSGNKKQAKAQAATAALQKMGLIPK